ncbi:hypothetical protein Bbelb_411580 [Branchiostoma belcheri]|nr:hypothetical protein Bbelb_411580 [Branchiostoma belcheri]
MGLPLKETGNPRHKQAKTIYLTQPASTSPKVGLREGILSCDYQAPRLCLQPIFSSDVFKDRSEMSSGILGSTYLKLHGFPANLGAVRLPGQFTLVLVLHANLKKRVQGLLIVSQASEKSLSSSLKDGGFLILPQQTEDG